MLIYFISTPTDNEQGLIHLAIEVGSERLLNSIFFRKKGKK